MINLYKIQIKDRYNDLKESGVEINNYNLAKIFEEYSAIKLSEEYNQTFLLYNDIPLDFKEKNNMSKNDTGIDLSNMEDSIVQCKLRKDNLNWKECSTFFGSQNAFDNELKKAYVRWNKLIITRNSNCKLSVSSNCMHLLTLIFYFQFFYFLYFPLFLLHIFLIHSFSPHIYS